MNTAGNEYTAGFVEHRANNGSWRVLPAAGNGVVGYGYGVGKTYPRVTRTEPYRPQTSTILCSQLCLSVSKLRTGMMVQTLWSNLS